LSEGGRRLEGEARGVAYIILRDRRFRGNKERWGPVVLGSIVIFGRDFNKC
jgi:hypothetical protein